MVAIFETSPWLVAGLDGLVFVNGEIGHEALPVQGSRESGQKGAIKQEGSCIFHLPNFD